MTGRIRAGIQEPEPGSRRATNAMTVKAWLLANPKGGMYWQVAHAVRLSVPATGRAVQDLQLFDDDLLVSVPAPRNGYAVRITWREVLRGESNQARHAATRLDRMAVRWDGIAAEYDRRKNPAMAGWLRSAARSMQTQAAELRALADAMA